MGTSKVLKYNIQLTRRIIIAQSTSKHWILSQYRSKQVLSNRFLKPSLKLKSVLLQSVNNNNIDVSFMNKSYSWNLDTDAIMLKV